MSNAAWLGIGIAYPLVIIFAAFLALRIVWNRIVRNHPGQTPADDAVSRRFQSCSIGIFNLGWSVNILADKDYLHLRPTLFLRAATSQSMSIPWEKIKPGKYQLFKKYRAFKLGDKTFVAPAWAVDLADSNLE
ncbi:MAG: hypothetical protein MK085_05235 [Phycisphaerales bacterium]|nr:hypothetical protein [Phycisphaerales bacterium]